MVQSSRMYFTNKSVVMVSRKYIAIVLMFCSLASCLKLQRNAEYDSNGDYWGAYTLNEWLVSERNLNCHVFAEAVDMTGMAEVFASIEQSTVIIPNDEAFAQLFSEMGIKSISEFEPVVLKEILSYLVMSQRYVSTDMADGAVIAAQNLVDKPLYLSKKSSSGNKQQLYVNNYVPAGVKNFAATTATVVMQDVAFKDHVAQIVSNVPYFKEYTLKTDSYKGEPNTDQVFEIQTEADTYLAKTRPESPFDLTMNCNTERIPLILYENKSSVDFYDDISFARVNFYVPKVDGIAANPFVLYDITDQAWELSEQGTDVTKFYKTVINQYTPTLSAENKVATFDFDEAGKWTSVDITDYILKHFKNPSPKPIAFTIAPANKFYSSVGILYIGFKKESKNDMTNKPSYIQILGRMNSRIILQNAKTLQCSESVVITQDNLLCTAPVVPDGLVYSPQNITYRIIESPKGGVLARNCLPLKEGDVFTQNEINEGAIKYYKTTAVSSDEFILRAGDYSGATLQDHVRMNVVIQ